MAARQRRGSGAGRAGGVGTAVLAEAVADVALAAEVVVDVVVAVKVAAFDCCLLSASDKVLRPEICLIT